MRKAVLAMVLLCAPGLLAQENPQPQARPEDATPSQVQAAPEVTALKPGHPLDPADVAVLTGKTGASGLSGYRMGVLPFGSGGYAGYPFTATQVSPGQFAPVSTATSAPFVPLVFGRAGNRSLFLFGRTTAFTPPLLFLPGARGFGSGLLLTPPAPRGRAASR